MKITVTLLVAAMAGLAPGLAGAAETTAPGEPGSGTYDVIWNSPSKNALGSMPIGNGDIGANVWVEPSGDLVLLISKTDAYDEFERLLKLGRIRIKTTPSLVQTGKTFQQKLSLQDGAIEILCGTTTARVWVDANHPVIQVDLQNPTPMEAQVTLETWRTAPRALDRRSGKEQEGHSCNYAGAKKRVNPDIILPHCAAQLAWCHHNIESQWKYMLELTGLGDQIPVDAAPSPRSVDARLGSERGEGAASTMTDPILKRTFGAVVRGTDMTAVSDAVLRSSKPSTSMSIQVIPLTQRADSPAAWLKAAEALADRITAPANERFAAHQAWWKQYWNRSWIEVTPAIPAEAAATKSVSEAYALQRFINACASRGALPIKFNGSLFTVDQVFDPDYRRWGGGYWWQNTRFPYWSMLYSGDYDLMQPLFKMYMDALPLRKAAARKYYGHDGAFYPETMLFWGNYTDNDYGIERKGMEDGLARNGYIRRYWQGGLELVGMMLDYYDATQDAAFRDNTLLPFATEITRFFDQHWKRGADGKVLYSPAQSLETWHTATNPLPEIVGLRFLLPRLLALPADDTLKAEWRMQLADQPEVPSVTDKNGKTRLLPAKTYGTRKNVENPELYAVFPYRSYTLMQGGDRLKTGINTWTARRNRGNACWQQQPIQAALLGLTHEAKALTAQRARGKAGWRFPGFYGPNYDWAPDQDHIAVFQIGLQRMLMQCEGDRILLLPAWPKEWNVSFKLHAPRQTTVEGVYRNGTFEQLKVMPESRRKDVEIAP